MSALRRSLRVLGLSPPAPTDEPTTPLGQDEEDGNPADNDNNNEEELHDDAPAPNDEGEDDHLVPVDNNDNDPAPNLTSRSRRLFNDLTADEELFELELKQKKLELEYNLFQIQGKRRLIEQRKEYERVRQQEARCTNAPVDDDDNTRHVEDVAPSAETFPPTTPTIATPDPVRSPSISVPAPDRANMEPHFTVPWITRVPAPAPITQDSQNTDAILKKLLARQSHAKELPEFSGLPGEWPLFIRQFERSTEVCGLTDDENALRLAKCLKGKAYDSVYSMLGLPENVPLIIDSLRMAFGRPDQIIKSLIIKAKSVPIVLETNYETLIHLSNSVRAIVATMKSMKCFGHMNNPQLIEDLLDKLPFSLKLAWCVQVDDDEPNLEDFSNWLGRQASAASRMPASTAQNYPVPAAPEREKRHKLCHQCRAPSHSIAQCPDFKKLDVERRWTLTSEKKLCFICLDNGHRTSACEHRRECGTEGCRSLHHPLLHRPLNWRNNVPTTN